MNKFEPTKTKGLAALTTNPDTTKRKAKLTDNSAQNQRLKLLDWLLEKTSITSKQAQTHLDIYYPPARIKELRQAGYQIITLWDNWTSEYGIKQRIARYVLTQKQPIELINESEVK